MNFTTRSIGEAREAFEVAHKSQFGFTYPDRTLVIETVGTQEYQLRRAHFMERFAKAYGHDASEEVRAHLA